jgi:hypothetical protein
MFPRIRTSPFSLREVKRPARSSVPGAKSFVGILANRENCRVDRCLATRGKRFVVVNGVDL